MAGTRETQKRYHFDCDCGCSILEFNRWYWNANDDDNCLSIIYYVRAEDSKYFSSFRKKIKIIWDILRGRESCLWDVVIDDKDLEKFKEYVSSL